MFCLFGQQGDDDTDAGRFCGFGTLTGISADRRMQDGFKLPASLLIREDPFAQFGPVELTAGVQHVVAELLHDLIQAGLAGPDQFPRKLVGIDYGNPRTSKQFCNGGLAAGDSAG